MSEAIVPIVVTNVVGLGLVGFLAFMAVGPRGTLKHDNNKNQRRQETPVEKTNNNVPRQQSRGDQIAKSSSPTLPQGQTKSSPINTPKNTLPLGKTKSLPISNTPKNTKPNTTNTTNPKTY